MSIAAKPQTVDISHILEFLYCETPQAWVQWATENPEIMLVDHANCEKKAAGTALNLMYRYVEYDDLLHMLSRLAREELRHFEQVITIMKKRAIAGHLAVRSGYRGAFL